MFEIFVGIATIVAAIFGALAYFNSRKKKKNQNRNNSVIVPNSRKPNFKVSLDNKDLTKGPAMTVGIWVNNVSTNVHDVIKISGELEGHPNRLTTSIVDIKYRLPIRIKPNDPEKIIVFICEFLEKDMLPESEWKIIIKLYSRWEGEEIEAGRLQFTLE